MTLWTHRQGSLQGLIENRLDLLQRGLYRLISAYLPFSESILKLLNKQQRASSLPPLNHLGRLLLRLLTKAE